MPKIILPMFSSRSFFFFWLCPAVCKIWVPQSGTKLVPPVLEARGLNHWTSREVFFWKFYDFQFLWVFFFLYYFYYYLTDPLHGRKCLLLFFSFYCSGFCHTLKWISHGFTCVPHPDPPSRLPPHPIPLGLPSAPALSTCLMHPTWAGDLFHPR